MRKLSILFIICAISTICPLSAQFTPPMKGFPTPQAASFGLYNQIPVTNFTGVPDVSIPLYELKHKDISLPITLSYHISSVKPSTHPSWVGLGWNLLAGGCITRKVNGYPDELQNVDKIETGYFGHYADLNRDDWYTDDAINNYLVKFLSKEVTPDEFNFNFCNYSGTFYMDHTGNWQVRSDYNIKVLFNKETDCICITDVRQNLQNGIKDYDAQKLNYRLINTITLVGPDGIKYQFGGKDATEYSIPYFQQVNGYLVATSWFLTKITSPNGHSISLSYSPDSPIFETKPLYTSIVTDGHSTGCLTRGNQTCNEMIVMFPTYLTKISIENNPDNYIQFLSSERKDLKLFLNAHSMDRFLQIDHRTPDMMTEKDWGVFYYEADGKNTKAIFAAPNIQTFKWKKLNEIHIKNGSVFRQLTFYYEENPLNTRRIRLKNIFDTSVPSDYIMTNYTFNYYGNNVVWPTYFTDREDHWGFLNDTTELRGTIDKNDYFYHREPTSDMSIRTAEMLSDIIYPTGARTHFIYEKNDYSQYIDKNNNLQSWSTVTTGGIRIKNIQRYSASKLIETRSYYYMNNFNSLADTANRNPVSSGILAKKPSYSCTFTTNMAGTNYKYEFFSSGTFGPYLSNSNGSHIGYSNVIEVSKDESGNILGYKKQNFSNFGIDIWGSEHNNEIPLCNSKYDDLQMNYLSDKSIERGRLLSEEYYTNKNTLKEKVLYKYSKIPGQDYIRALSYNNYYVGKYSGENKVFYMMDAYKKYTYSYRLTEKQTFKYGDTTDSYIASTDTYSYIDNNLLSKETHTIGNGFKKQTTYNYPKDYPRNPVYQQMVASNIITPIEIINMLQSPKTEFTFLSNELFTYAIQDGLPYLSSYKKAIKQQSDLAEYYCCHKIDSRGNPLHISLRGEPETVYIWSDNYLYPVAEIKNATYSQVQSAMAEVTDLNGLYSALPEAQVTLFEFTSDCQRTREQDPRGVNTYFNYNPFGWLRNITDHNSNILKQFDYDFSL